MFYTLTAVALGFLLDLLLGDPQGFPHPVRLIGRAIEKLERLLRARFPKDAGGERIGGALLTLLVVAGSGLAAWGLLRLAGLLHPLARFLLETVMCYQLLAARSLRDESMKVYAALERGDLPGARAAVSMIVGRDPDVLDAEGVAKAAVETVAENASDGVIAPLFWMLLGGAPLGFCYKAVNTLDSMIGYKNERYLRFGRCAARLDDLANWIPARLAALLMILSAGLCGFDAAGAARVWRRDRRRHASPNSAQTEAACAGALGLRLVGDAVYGGVRVQKPSLGDAVRPAEAEDIPRANRLMYGTAALGLLFLGAARLLIFMIR